MSYNPPKALLAPEGITGLSHGATFLSYSRRDQAAADCLRKQLCDGQIEVFKDDASIREGDPWLGLIERALDSCGAFVVLVGASGVRRWVAAETHAALIRHIDPEQEADRLPIFPVLLPGVSADALPALLRPIQATHWNGHASLPDRLLQAIRDRALQPARDRKIDGNPYVGLAAFQRSQAHLFFGRQRETLDALSCFESRPDSAPVRWLEVGGSSGSGKSSLVNAGLLPLIEEGWLWRRTKIEHWHCIGPMMPGGAPRERLAEALARAFGPQLAEMSNLDDRLQGKDQALCHWLRGRKQASTAFLLVIDQFEELFTFADRDQRRDFDRQLATALNDPECPLYLITTVRSDFLNSFATDLPRLVEARNRWARQWTLGPISDTGLREVIEGPARLAGLDVSEVRAAIVADAKDTPGALPLVENALDFLWARRSGQAPLSGILFNDEGGLAGILSKRADGLLAPLQPAERRAALELLFQLVQVDPEGQRHTRRRIPLQTAIEWAGGREVIDHLAGNRDRDRPGHDAPVRLITITDDGTEGPQVDLIHETLVRLKRTDPGRPPQPYWPTLWNHIRRNMKRATRRERLRLQAQDWSDRRGLSRVLGLAGWSSLWGPRAKGSLGRREQTYLRWSRRRAIAELLALAAILVFAAENIAWAGSRGYPVGSLYSRWAYRLGVEIPMPTLVEVPSGRFWMGDVDGDASRFRPSPHEVVIPAPFWLSQTEVTFAQYDAFCEATSRTKPSDQWGRDDLPVIYVDWHDAQAYAGWLGAMTGRTCRLPSEAEWEYAARAGTTKAFALPAESGGSDDISWKNLANCDGCGSPWDDTQTAPVARFEPNAWGLHDMHGNVWEWVEDCWHDAPVTSTRPDLDDGTAFSG